MKTLTNKEMAQSIYYVYENMEFSIYIDTEKIHSEKKEKDAERFIREFQAALTARRFLS